MCGFGRCPTNLGGIVIEQWLNYKDGWLQRVYNFAMKVEAKLLLFKMANFICGDLRTGIWSTYDTLYRSFDNATIEKCYRVNIQDLNGAKH